MSKEIYQAFEWETGKPTLIYVDQQSRRAYMKDMMKNDGVGDSGTWLEFRPVEAPTIVQQLHDTVSKLWQLHPGMGIRPEGDGV